LAEALSKSVKQEDMVEVFRLASLIETLAEPLVEAGFEMLVVYNGQFFRQFFRQFFNSPMTDSEPPRSASFPEEALDAAVIEIVGKNNPHAYSTISFIHRSLMQFNLASQFEPHEILNDAYVRGKNFIRSGGIIRNPHSWLKSTSLNIIRENSRKQKREQLIDPELVELIPSLRVIEDSVVSQEDIDKKWKALLSSLKILSRTDPEGARLLRLRAKGLSWKEIQQQLVKEDGGTPNESTLRQKASRAKKILRKIYHSTTSDSADMPIP
jgi:DNA-directed RNA polymerase specialized sigma24 family protein